jgi:hypothetical protein
MLVPAAFTVKLVAETPPKLTSVAPSKCWPVMTTFVPPPAGPLAGKIPVTIGEKYVYSSATVIALVPFGPETVTSTVPSPAGTVALICVSLC